MTEVLMTIQVVREALLLCTLINYGVLIIWFLLLVLPHEWLYRLWRKCFRLSNEQFDAVNFTGMALFKIGIMLFNLVPYVALRIVGSG
jgi:hypothetical protein